MNSMQPSVFPDEDSTVQRAPRLVGDGAIWVFICAELLAFAVFFAAYAFARAFNAEAFAAGQATLDRASGMINTLLLLASSYFVVRSAQAVEVRDSRQGARWMLAAIGAGLAFVVVKAREYMIAFDAGVTLESSVFDMFYLSLTFFHFAHVLLGLGILAIICLNIRRGHYNEDMNGLESGAAYWHMVDAVWLVLFPLVYVVH